MNASSTPPSTSPDPLVDALEARLRRIDLIGWAQITMRADELGLSLADLRLILALSARSGACSVSEIARLSGLPLDAAYRGANRLRGRGYLHEERRRYSLSEDGLGLMSILETAHRQGIQAYVDGLDDRDRQFLEEAVRGGERSQAGSQ